MSGISGKYKELKIVENITANGDYPAGRYLNYGGEAAIAMYGTMDTATVEFVFFTEKSDETLHEIGTPADFSFTEFPLPAAYSFPDQMPFKIRVSSVGASTDISINLHRVR